MTPWLAIVGIGEAGLDSLTPAARAAVESAELLAGGERHLAMVPEGGQERLPWPTPLTDAFDELESWRGRPVCVLASGDPQWFGVGVTLHRRFPPEETLVIPSPSAFSLAAARLGWSLADVVTLTLHGRSVAGFEAAVQPGVRVLALSRDGTTPAAVAEILRRWGFADSRLVVLERLGGPAERVIEGSAQQWPDTPVADLNVIAVECVAGPDARVLARTPGLPDDVYRHDGQLTKREVRAATLAALMPLPGQRLWDVGAGCGSVAIEWLRAAPWTRAIAVEREARRLVLIAENATALGTPELEVVEGSAPDALGGLAAPDAVFVGGGLAAAGSDLLEVCWQALGPGGRLVANAVTLEGERALAEWRAGNGADLARIAVSRAEGVGPYTGWRPLMPVTQLRAAKPWGGA